MAHKLHSLFKSVAEQIIPDPVGDFFDSHGTLSAPQFVHCGNILVNNFPSWMWDSGKKENRHPFLPEEKQFLYTTNILSNRIINKQEYKEHQVEETTKDDWTITEHSNIYKKNTNVTQQPSYDDNEIKLDIDDDPNALLDEIDPNTRHYDLYITYDKYYQTPRFWIFGYNHDNIPLGFNELMEDVSSDYVNKTVTYEYHPHIPILTLSIHPCRHGEVMKSLIKQYRESGKDINIDHYMFIFLKFISSIIPNINYDKTFDI